MPLSEKIVDGANEYKKDCRDPTIDGLDIFLAYEKKQDLLGNLVESTPEYDKSDDKCNHHGGYRILADMKKLSLEGLSFGASTASGRFFHGEGHWYNFFDVLLSSKS